MSKLPNENMEYNENLVLLAKTMKEVNSDLNPYAKPVHPCMSCGTISGVSYRKCPYAYDVHNTIVWVWRCNPCDYEACMDI